ncbi:MAG: chemotaxis protein CheC [Oscillospiraceae bacterium]
MALKNIDELNDMQVDVLREIGNIGSGNAATSLSGLVGQEILINVPVVRILGFDDAVGCLGGAEKIIAGLLIRIDGDINGMILYAFGNEFSAAIINTFFGKSIESVLEMDEMDSSALCEIGNIMAASYVNALSSMTGLFINISPPDLCVDMAGAVLSVPAVEFAKFGDKVLLIDDSFALGNETVRSNMILVPEIESLDLLFNRLGVV